MAQAAKFPEANFSWKGNPKEGVVDLEVLRTTIGCYSNWDLTDEEVAEIVKTKKIWMFIGLRDSHPAVGLTAIEPAEVAMERAAEKQPIDIKLRLDKAS